MIIEQNNLAVQSKISLPLISMEVLLQKGVLTPFIISQINTWTDHCGRTVQTASTRGSWVEIPLGVWTRVIFLCCFILCS